VARHTPYVTAVVSGDLADQGEAQANTTLATLTHTGGTVEGRKDTLPLLFWHAGPAVGNAEAGSGGVRGTTEASTGEPAA